MIRQEKTRESCISALLSSPNPAKLSTMELKTRLSSILPLVVRTNSTHAKDVHLTTFNEVKGLFERLPTGLDLQDTVAKTALEKILFDATFEGLPEAMRMRRAEALVAVGKVGGCGWVVERVAPEVEGSERSVGVRNVLAKVGKSDG